MIPHQNFRWRGERKQIETRGRQRTGRERYRARISKLLRSLGIDSKESIPLAYVAWRRYDNPISYSVPSPHRLFKNSSTGVKVRQPYSYSVSNPHRMFKISAQAESIPVLLKILRIRAQKGAWMYWKSRKGRRKGREGTEKEGSKAWN